MKRVIKYGIAIAVVGLITVLATSLGSFDFDVFQVLKSYLTAEPTFASEKYVLFNIRLPRVIGAFAVGATLALGGTLLQGLFRNPLADPSIIGISSGAAMCAVVLMALNLPTLIVWGYNLSHLIVPIGAFSGALFVGLLAYRISQSKGQDSLSLLLLCGIAFQFISMSVVGIVLFMVGDEKLRSINFWMMGSLGSISWTNLLFILLFSFPMFLMSFRLADSLNAFSMGENHALALGTNVQRTKSTVILITTLAIGASVAYCGVIGFIGLVAPHLARLMVGSNHKRMIPLAFLIGGSITVFSDLCCRTLFAPEELPLSIVTSILGAPLLFLLILRSRKQLARV